MKRETSFKIILIFVMTGVSIAALYYGTLLILNTGKYYYTYSELRGGPYESYYNRVDEYKYWWWERGKTFELDHGEFQYDYDINSLGFRGPEVPSKKKTKFRILTLGDSFTEGCGAPADSSMPYFLEKFLLKDYPFIEVINAGVSGSDPFFQLVAMEDYLYNKIQPDMVIVFTNEGDLHDFYGRGGFERFKRHTTEFRKGPSWEDKYAESQLYRLYAHKIKGVDQFLLNEAQRAYLFEDYSNQMDTVWTRFKDLARKKDFLFYICNYPIPIECLFKPGTQEFDTINNNFLKLADQWYNSDGFSFINAYPGIKRKLNKENIYELSWPIDGHYKGSGYHMFAEVVHEELMKKEHLVKAMNKFKDELNFMAITNQDIN